MTEGNKTDQKETNITPDSIKSWIKEHLKSQNSIMYAEGRNVIIKTMKGHKIVSIPSLKQTGLDPNLLKEKWMEAWMEVHRLALAALEEKVQFLCLNDPDVTHIDGSKIKVGDKIITIASEENIIAYTRSLESIVTTYEKLKIAQKEERKVKDDSPEQFIISEHHVTLSEVDRVATKRLENDTQTIAQEETVKAPIVSNPAPTSDDLPTLKGFKISDGDRLTKKDLSTLRELEKDFVLVTCADLSKDENTFRDNAELCEEANLPIGACLSGKATTSNDIPKEVKRLFRLLNDYEFSGPIIYEVNNEYILASQTDKMAINTAINTAIQISELLINENYPVILAMDYNTKKLLTDLNLHYDFSNGIIYRVLPREMDQVEPDDSIILMDPQYDCDIVKLVNSPYQIASQKPLAKAA